MNDGVGLLDDGDPAGALPILTEATHIDPHYGLAWLNLGLARKRLRQWPEAMDAFLKARLHIPADAPTDIRASALWNVGVLASLTSDWATAMAAWQDLGITVKPGPDGTPAAPLGMGWVRREGFAPALGTRIDPARLRVTDTRFNETALRTGTVVVHDGSRIATLPHAGLELPVFPAL